METNVLELLPAEKEALLEALHRDLRSQRSLAMHDAGWEVWHQRNVQLNPRLLETINPKRRNSSKLICKDSLTEFVLTKDGDIEHPRSTKLPSEKVKPKDFCLPA